MPTAEGKVTTARLMSGDRIMVRAWVRDGVLSYDPSPTKKKDAVPLTVQQVIPVYSARRRTYTVAGVLPSGEPASVSGCSGSQTFWRAT